VCAFSRISFVALIIDNGLTRAESLNRSLASSLARSLARSHARTHACTHARTHAHARVCVTKYATQQHDTAGETGGGEIRRSSREFATPRKARVTIRPVRITAHRTERINARPLRTTMFPYRGGRIELNTVSRANYKMAERHMPWRAMHSGARWTVVAPPPRRHMSRADARGRDWRKTPNPAIFKSSFVFLPNVLLSTLNLNLRPILQCALCFLFLVFYLLLFFLCNRFYQQLYFLLRISCFFRNSLTFMIVLQCALCFLFLAFYLLLFSTCDRFINNYISCIFLICVFCFF